MMTTGGALQTRQSYFPYGDKRVADGSALPTGMDTTFTGQKSDDSTGLMFYGARYYDTTLGRFTQADSIVSGAMNPQNLNRYAYTLNNPVRYTDPSGHMVPSDNPPPEPLPPTPPDHCLVSPADPGCSGNQPSTPPADTGGNQDTNDNGGGTGTKDKDKDKTVVAGTVTILGITVYRTFDGINSGPFGRFWSPEIDPNDFGKTDFAQMEGLPIENSQDYMIKGKLNVDGALGVSEGTAPGIGTNYGGGTEIRIEDSFNQVTNIEVYEYDVKTGLWDKPGIAAVPPPSGAWGIGGGAGGGGGGASPFGLSGGDPAENK